MTHLQHLNFMSNLGFALGSGRIEEANAMATGKKHITARTVTYDPKCYELAALFLQDVGLNQIGRVCDLAGHIQESIEDWIKGETAAPPVDVTLPADGVITPELGAKLTQIAIDTEPEEKPVTPFDAGRDPGGPARLSDHTTKSVAADQVGAPCFSDITADGDGHEGRSGHEQEAAGL